jgi:hypothetical protein
LMQDAVGSGTQWRMGGASSLRLSAPRPGTRSWGQGSSALRSKGGRRCQERSIFTRWVRIWNGPKTLARQDAPVQRPPPKSHITPPGSRIQDISKRSWPLNVQPSLSFISFQVLFVHSVCSCSNHL